MTKQTIGTLLLFLLTLIPFSFADNPTTSFIADPYSELPVKLWAYQEFFGWDVLFGKHIDSVGYPNNTGLLNNPDIFATVFIGILRPILPEALCYNLMLCLIMFINLWSAWLLSYRWNRDTTASALAAIVFAWSPVVLSYCVAGAITDVYHIWPYPLGIWLFLRGLETRAKYALGGGVVFGLGFILCPYNFVIFTPIAIPMLVWLYLQKGYHQVGRKLSLLLLSAGLITLGYALQILDITRASESQISEELLQQTRHHWPFRGLRVDLPDRYCTSLLDFFTYGKEQIVIRDAGARFYRSFSIPLTVIFLSLLSLWKRQWLWGITAIFFILLSMGPFMAISSEIASERPINLPWLTLFYIWPGSNMILEPFRYALPAFLALGIFSSIGLASIRWTWLKIFLFVICGTELLFRANLPFPLPETHSQPSEIYYNLDTELPDGGIVEIPYYSRGSYRFVRKHFRNQQAHQRPIPDLIPGFLPDIYKKNDILHHSLEIEAPYDVQAKTQKNIDRSIQELKTLGFVAIIVDLSEYADPLSAQLVEQFLNQHLPTPIKEDMIRVYRLP